MSDLYWLTDDQMARLVPYFPKSHGKPRVDDRRVLSGIVFVNRNGLRWCDAPSAYGGPVRGCSESYAKQLLRRIDRVTGCVTWIAHDRTGPAIVPQTLGTVEKDKPPYF